MEALGITPAVLRAGLIIYILLFASLILRAYAQAWLADRLGDRTPRDEGRVTLYPVPHIDMLGTVILPLFCIFYLQAGLGGGGFFLAWANPVPINPANFKNPQRDYLLTQFAGFFMSALIGVLAAIAGGLFTHVDFKIADLLQLLIIINCMLIVLDFLPVPPLPGGWLLKHLGIISEDAFWAMAQWSGIILSLAFAFLPPVRYALAFLMHQVEIPFDRIFFAVAGMLGK